MATESMSMHPDIAELCAKYDGNVEPDREQPHCGHRVGTAGRGVRVGVRPDARHGLGGAARRCLDHHRDRCDRRTAGPWSDVVRDDPAALRPDCPVGTGRPGVSQRKGSCHAWRIGGLDRCPGLPGGRPCLARVPLWRTEAREAAHSASLGTDVNLEHRVDVRFHDSVVSSSRRRLGLRPRRGSAEPELERGKVMLCAPVRPRGAGTSTGVRRSRSRCPRRRPSCQPPRRQPTKCRTGTRICLSSSAFPDGLPSPACLLRPT